MLGRSHRRLIVTALFLCMALLLGTGIHHALRQAEQTLRDRVLDALGPYGTVSRIIIGLGGIELTDVRIGRPEQPALEAFAAHRIHITPDYGDALLGRFTLAVVRIDQARLTLLRERQGWQMFLPLAGEPPAALTTNTSPAARSERTPTTAKSPSPSPLRIDRLEIDDASLELVDNGISRPPHRVSFEHLNLILHPLHLPDMRGQSTLTLSAELVGGEGKGRITATGYIGVQDKEYGLHVRVRSADLRVAQPYFSRGAALFAAGTFDLDIDAACQENRLYAPGTLTLNDLVLGGPGAERLSRLQRMAVQTALRDSHGRLSSRFTAEGSCQAPQVNYDANPQTRIAQALFRALGLSLAEFARGIGLPRQR